MFCGWQAVANMQTACSAISYGDDSTDVSVDSAVFSPEKPSSSNNLDPSTDYADRVQYGYVMGEKMDGCNLHAFCSACTVACSWPCAMMDWCGAPWKKPL